MYKYLGVNSLYGYPIGYGQDVFMDIYMLSEKLEKLGYVVFK